MIFMSHLLPRWIARMDSTQRFHAYVRGSLHVSIVLLAAVLVLPALQQPQPLWLTTTALLVTVANLAFTLG